MSNRIIQYISVARNLTALLKTIEMSLPVACCFFFPFVGNRMRCCNIRNLSMSFFNPLCRFSHYTVGDLKCTDNDRYNAVKNIITRLLRPIHGIEIEISILFKYHSKLELFRVGLGPDWALNSYKQL